MLPASDVALIREKFDAGIGMRAAVRDLGLAKNTVSRYYRQFRIERRERGEASPDADSIALAIVAAEIETGEDAEACARGVYGLHCRHYAFHALMHAYPTADKHAIARCVGSTSEHQFPFLSNRSRQEAKWWDETLLRRVLETLQEDMPTQREPIILRRPPVRCAEDVTASLMGDPPPSRSALADKLAHVELSEDA